MKIKKTYRLHSETVDHINEVKEKYQLSETAALEKIVLEHQDKNISVVSKAFTKELSKAVADELKNTLTRIRLGTNNADKNSEILLLMINQLLNYTAIKTYVEKQSVQFIESKRIVEARIQAFKTKKSSQKQMAKKETSEQSVSSEHASEDDFFKDFF